MPIEICPTHQLAEVVICCEGECLRRFCDQCFLTHKQQHKIGVVLSISSKMSLIEWNTFLLDKFKQIQSNIKTKGISAIYEMRLNPSYPKGLINELNNHEMAQVGIKIIQQYLQTLVTNIQFISTRESLDELDIPELLKDIYVFFVYETSKGLNFLAERVQMQLRQKFADKKIYEYVDFAFVPKQLRVLEIKRKSIVKNVEQLCLIQPKQKIMSPIKVSTPTKITQNSPSLARSGTRSYGQNIVVTNNSPTITKKDSNVQIIQPASPRGSHIRIQGVTRTDSNIVINRKSQQQIVEVKFEKQPQFANEKIQPQLIRQDRQDTQQKNQIKDVNQQFASVIAAKQIEIKVKQSQNATLLKENENLKAIQYQNADLLKGNENLKCQIADLSEKMKIKQRSIRQLNNLISNQQQQLQYRENEVQILTQQIRKLMVFKVKSDQLAEKLEKAQKQLKFKQRSIAELNSLICNQQQEIQSRENEVETLTIEIKKLVEWKQRCEEIEKKLNDKEKQLDEREKGIKELNNVIGNQEQQLAYRESEVQMLNSELRKLNQAKVTSDERICQLSEQNALLHTKVLQYEQALKVQQKQESSKMAEPQNFDEQLMEQVIELQSQVVARNEDIKNLVEIINKFQKYMPSNANVEVVKSLKNLKTVKIQ